MDVAQTKTLHVTPDEARPRPNDDGHPSVLMLAHGSMELRWYRPSLEAHTPHDRDELYVIVSGTGTFHCSNEDGPFEENHLGAAGERHVEVAAGDALFVPAGAEHFFDGISDDFAAWTVFYGPEGGEPR